MYIHDNGSIGSYKSTHFLIAMMAVKLCLNTTTMSELLKVLIIKHFCDADRRAAHLQHQLYFTIQNTTQYHSANQMHTEHKITIRTYFWLG